MKVIFFILTIIFIILTFTGAGYVLFNNVNAGFAVIPLLFALIFLQSYRNIKKKDNSN